MNDEPTEDVRRPPRPSRPRSAPWLWVSAAAAALGALFSALSTSDFVNHLDRQLHAVHCSFIPGMGAELGESGCRTVMMSPYSSVFRESFWGGLPVALWSLAVFMYLLVRSLHFALKPRPAPRHTAYLFLAWCLPLLMSLVYGTLSAVRVGALCKLCMGIYAASALGFVAAVLAHLRTGDGEQLDARSFLPWFLEGVGFVAVVTLCFMLAAPKTEASAKGCGTLVKKEDPAGVFIPLPGGHGTRALAVLDPLCPACRGFDQRLEASSVRARLDMNLVLFPLDSTCNWMVKKSLHAGACAVSEALLCDKAHAATILAYAFDNQDALREQAATDEPALRRRLEQQFPAVKGCLGSAGVRTKLNKSLRWTVANALPVLTPQLFVGDRRVCDEDTDLGLEYTVASMLEDAGRKP